MRIPFLLVAVLLAGAATAEDTLTAESLSEIRDFEIASLDAPSIEARGGISRFDVRVKWRDPEQRPPNAPASRIVRYVAKCGEKTLGVAAVAAIDQNGKMLKSYVIPPGGTDFLPAKEGSREAQWLAQVCR
ncbi:MAG TPA: hypothetical protein VF460_11575 [Burkholderiales bacterium]